ncbi:MAG: hypothetical protein AAF283_05685, partial [Cyanobacteria bacterium P01_A01_bin.70]
MTPSTAPQQSYSQSPLANSALLEGLKPPLRSTLSSLNINLDYELARYRYAKRGEAQPGVAPPQFQSRRQRSLNLINVPTPAKPVKLPATAAAAPPPPPNPRIAQTANSSAPAPVSDPVPATATGSVSEVANLKSALVRQAAPQPDNYLESSEALLQNFDNSYPATGSEPSPTAKSWFEGINTPLGLGALLLLLVASAGFGFVLVNPSAAQNLFGNTPLARFWPGAEVDEVEAVDGVTADADAITSPEGPPLSALGPDLSQREFSTLDLNTLSNLPSNASPLAGQPTPLATDRPGNGNGLGANQTNAGNAAANTTSAAGTPTPQQVNQIPQNITPAPRPAAIAPTNQAPAAAPAPAPAPQPAAAPVAPAPATANPSPAVSQPPVSSYYV